MPEYGMIPVKEATKELVDEQKPDGVTYDYWVKDLMGENDDA